MSDSLLRFLLLFLSIFLISADVRAEGEGSPIQFTIRVGESIQLDAPEPGIPVVIGNSKVLAYRIAAGRLWLSGKAAGFSSVVVGTQAYSVTVMVGAEGRDSQQILESLLENSPGVRVISSGGRLLIVGEALSQADLARIQQVADVFGATSLATVSRRVLMREPMVRVTLHFAEVADELLQRVGMDWGQGIFRAGLTGLLLGEGYYALLGGASGWELVPTQERGDSLVDFDEATQRVHIIDSHTMTVLDGHEDSYFRGGTLLIPLQGGLGSTSTLQSVDHGVKVRVVPHTDELGAVHLSLDYEITRVNPNSSARSYSLERSSQKTDLMLTAHEALGVAMYEIEHEGADRSGLPWLQRIPLLGTLFGTQGYQHSRRRGLILVTAHRLSPAETADVPSLKLEISPPWLPSASWPDPPREEVHP